MKLQLLYATKVCIVKAFAMIWNRLKTIHNIQKTAALTENAPCSKRPLSPRIHAPRGKPLHPRPGVRKVFMS